MKIAADVVASTGMSIGPINDYMNYSSKLD
jgi:hypothetical protein